MPLRRQGSCRSLRAGERQAGRPRRPATLGVEPSARTGCWPPRAVSRTIRDRIVILGVFPGGASFDLLGCSASGRGGCRWAGRWVVTSAGRGRPRSSCPPSSGTAPNWRGTCTTSRCPGLRGRLGPRGSAVQDRARAHGEHRLFRDRAVAGHRDRVSSTPTGHTPHVRDRATVYCAAGASTADATDGEGYAQSLTNLG